jgi:hypothetical protein
MCTPTNADKLLDLSTLADAIANRFANPKTHPTLWQLYRNNAHEALIDHMQNQPLPEVLRG